MQKGLCFSGNLILDQLKFIQQYPHPGTLTTITQTELSLGGLVCNCALDAIKLDPGIPVSVIGRIGTDSAGDYILSQLGRHSTIDTSGIRRSGITSYTDVVTEPSGRRTFFHCRGANAGLCPQDFDFDRIQADILHIGYILLLDSLDAPDAEYPTALCRVLADAQAHGIQTSVDIVSEEGQRYTRLVPPALRYTDYCFLNEIEAERTTGIPLRNGDILIPENFRPCLEALKKMGVKRWAVIHTPEMSFGLDMATGKDWREPSVVLPNGFIISSVGAGDAYATGMLLGAYYGWTLQKSMRTAAAVAAWSLSGKGASDALTSLSDILASLQNLKNGGTAHETL